MKLLYSSRLLFLFAGSPTIFTSALEKKHNLRRNSAVGGDERQLEHHGAGHVIFPAPVHAPVHAPVPRSANVPHVLNSHPTSSGSYYNGPEPQGYQKMEPYGYNHPYPNGNDRPTPNPSDRPTPSPTPRPTNIPTPNPTPRPTPHPTSQPTPSPTTQPSAEPTREPSAAPSPQPSAAPFNLSEFPSTSPAPSSPEPTYSEEPSENPTQSEEPSENPTQSDEPSENPTQSEEPSETPTQNNDVNPGSRTFAAIICDPKNASTWAALCAAIQADPAVFALLNDLSFNVNGEILPINIPPRLAINVGGRKLQGVGSGQRLTMFAPNNQAFEKFYQMPFNQLFNTKAPEVVSYFNNLDIDVVSDSAIVSADFFVSANGKRFLNELLLGHIIPRQRTDSHLVCQSLSSMQNGKFTMTTCDHNSNNDTNRKFQVGVKNTERNAPKIIQKDVAAINGIIHVVNNVIITELEVPSNAIQLDESFFSPPDVIAAP